MFQGTPKQLVRSKESRTGNWLSGRSGFSSAAARRSTGQGWVKLRGARGNNLQNLTVEFPARRLLPGDRRQRCRQKLARRQNALPRPRPPIPQRRRRRPTCPHRSNTTTCSAPGRSMTSSTSIKAPIGRSPRSNPATYIKALDPIRTLFAEQLDCPHARAHREPFQLQRRRRPLRNLQRRRIPRHRHAVHGQRLHEMPRVWWQAIPATSARSASTAA